MWGFASLFTREVLRNPWAWALGLGLALLSLAFRGRPEGVAVLSIYGLLLLFVPPAILALAIPLLSAREEWAFWAAMPRPAGRLYLAAALGVGLGFLFPFLFGGGLAASLVGLSPAKVLWLLGALVLVVAFWVGVSAFAGALVLEPGRALGVGLFVWGLLVLAYDPVVVALAVAFRDYPLEGFLLAVIFANPLEILRVSLLKALNAPVLVGPVGYLLDRLLGQVGYWPLLFSFALSLLVFFGVAALVFSRRDR